MKPESQIPAVGRKSQEGYFWAIRLTRWRKSDGTRAWRKSTGWDEHAKPHVVQSQRDRAKARWLGLQLPWARTRKDKERLPTLWTAFYAKLRGHLRYYGGVLQPATCTAVPPQSGPDTVEMAQPPQSTAVNELGAVSTLPSAASAATGADLSCALLVSTARRMMVS